MSVLAELRHYDDAPAEEVSVAALMAKADECAAAQREAERAYTDAAYAARDVKNQALVVTRAREALVAAETRLGELQDVRAREQARYQSSLEAAGAFDHVGIKAEIAAANDRNAKVVANREYDAQRARRESLIRKSEELTRKIEEIDAAKAKTLGEAKFPIQGLAFDENAVTFRGLPFDQASSAEQLAVSVAMGLALNPKLKVLLIRDGSLLDEESLALVARMADEAKAQVWIERVGDGAECSVVIEDGQLRGVTESDGGETGS